MSLYRRKPQITTDQTSTTSTTLNQTLNQIISPTAHLPQQLITPLHQSTTATVSSATKHNPTPLLLSQLVLSQRFVEYNQCHSPESQGEFLTKIAQDFFHIQTPHLIQIRCIKDLLNGTNVFLRLPTSGGKSLIYQVYGQITQSCVFIITPLISLADDQVSILNKLGLRAISMSKLRESDAATQLPSLHYQYIFITPERLLQSGNSSQTSMKSIISGMVQNKQISLFAIDEAHCICQWGSDFRTEYGELGWLQQNFPHIPILAMTATATKDTSDEIQKSLHLPSNNTNIYLEHIDRPNITYLSQKGEKGATFDGLHVFYRTLFSNKHRETVCFGRLWDTKYICPVLLNQYKYLQAFDFWFSNKVTKYVQKYGSAFIFDPKKYILPDDISINEFENYTIVPLSLQGADKMGLTVDLTENQFNSPITNVSPQTLKKLARSHQDEDEDEDDEYSEQKYLDYHYICTTYPKYVKPFTSFPEYNKYILSQKESTQHNQNSISMDEIIQKNKKVTTNNIHGDLVQDYSPLALFSSSSPPYLSDSTSNLAEHPPFCPMCISTSGSHLLYSLTVKMATELHEMLLEQEYIICGTKMLRKYAPSLRDKCSLTYGHCLGIDTEEKKNFQLYARLPFRALPQDFVRNGIPAHWNAIKETENAIKKTEKPSSNPNINQLTNTTNSFRDSLGLPPATTLFSASSTSSLNSTISSSLSINSPPSINPPKSFSILPPPSFSKHTPASNKMSRLMQEDSDDEGLLNRRSKLSQFHSKPAQISTVQFNNSAISNSTIKIAPTIKLSPSQPQLVTSSQFPLSPGSKLPTNLSSTSAPPKRSFTYTIDDSDEDSLPTKKQKTTFPSSSATTTVANNIDSGDSPTNRSDFGNYVSSSSLAYPPFRDNHNNTTTDILSNESDYKHNYSFPNQNHFPQHSLANQYHDNEDDDMFLPNLESDSRSLNYNNEPSDTFKQNDQNSPLPPPPLPPQLNQFAAPQKNPNLTKTMIPTAVISNENVKSIIPILCPTQLYTHEEYQPVIGLYHGSLTTLQRTSIHEQFIDNSIDILVATIAFGMGINIPFIHSVVHYGCPRSLNNYHQESGRGGRNILTQALSVVLYNNSDLSTSRNLIMSNRNVALIHRELKELNLINKLVKTIICKRRVLNSTFAIPDDNDDSQQVTTSASLFQFCFGDNLASLSKISSSELNCKCCDVCLFSPDIAEQSYLQFKNDLLLKQSTNPASYLLFNGPVAMNGISEYEHQSTTTTSSMTLHDVLPPDLQNSDKITIDAVLRRWVLSQGIYFNETKPNQYLLEPPETLTEARRVTPLLPALNITKPAIAMLKLIKIITRVGSSTLVKIIWGSTAKLNELYLKRAWTIYDYSSTMTTSTKFFNDKFWTSVIDWLNANEYIQEEVCQFNPTGPATYSRGKMTNYISYKLTQRGEQYLISFDSSYSSSYSYPIYRFDQILDKEMQFTPYDAPITRTTPHSKVRITTLCNSFSSLRNQNLSSEMKNLQTKFSAMTNTSGVKETQLGMVFPFHPAFTAHRPLSHSFGSGHYYCLFEDICVQPQHHLYAQLSNWDHCGEYFLTYNAEVQQRVNQLRRAMGDSYPANIPHPQALLSPPEPATNNLLALPPQHQLLPPPPPSGFHHKLVSPPPPIPRFVPPLPQHNNLSTPKTTTLSPSSILNTTSSLPTPSTSTTLPIILIKQEQSASSIKSERL